MLAADLSSSLVSPKGTLANPSSIRATGDFGITLAASLSDAKPVLPPKQPSERKPSNKRDANLQLEPSTSDSDAKSVSVTTIANPPLPVPLAPNPLQLPDVTVVPLSVDTLASSPERTGCDPMGLVGDAPRARPAVDFPATVAFAQNGLSLLEPKPIFLAMAAPQSRTEGTGTSEIPMRDHAATESQASNGGNSASPAQRALNQIPGTNLKPEPRSVALQSTTYGQLATDLAAVQVQTKGDSGTSNHYVRALPAATIGPPKPMNQVSLASSERASFTVGAPKIVSAQWTVSEPGPLPQRPGADIYKVTVAADQEARSQPIRATTPSTLLKNEMDLPRATGTFTSATVAPPIRATVPSPVTQSVLYKVADNATDKAALQFVNSVPAPAPQIPLVDADKVTGIAIQEAPRRLVSTSVPDAVSQSPSMDVPKPSTAPIQQVNSQSVSTNAADFPPQIHLVDVTKGTPNFVQPTPPNSAGASATVLTPKIYLVDVPQLNAVATDSAQPRSFKQNPPAPVPQSPLVDIPTAAGAAPEQRLTQTILPNVSSFSRFSGGPNFKVVALNPEAKLASASEATKANTPSAQTESSPMQNSATAAATPTTRATTETTSVATVSAEPAALFPPQQSKAPEAGHDKTQYGSPVTRTNEDYSAAVAGIQNAEPVPSESPLANVGSKDGGEKKPSALSSQPVPATADTLASPLLRDAGTTVVVSPGTPSAPSPSSETSEAPKYQQFADVSPPLSNLLPAHINTAPDGEMQMHVGIRTAAFGAVEIYTSVHQNQVGLTVRGEHGMAHWLVTEMQSIQSGLNDHHLNLTTMEMDKGGNGLQTGSGSQQQPQQRNFFASRNSQSNNLIRDRPDETKPIETALPVLSWRAGSHVSIHV